jgi:hypothetical protein
MGTKGDPKTPHSRSRDLPAPPKDGTKVKSTGLKIIEIPGFLSSFLDQGRSRGAPKTPRGRSKDHKDSPRTPQGPPKTRKRPPKFRWFFAMFSNGFKTLGFSRILTPKSVSARSRPQNQRFLSPKSTSASSGLQNQSNFIRPGFENHCFQCQ